MPINRAKAKEFLEKNKGLLEEFDKAEAQKAERLGKLTARRKALNDQLETLKANMEWMIENIGEEVKQDPQYKAALQTFLGVMSQTNAIAQESTQLLTPKREAPQPEEVFFPDADDPSGFSSHAFAPGEIIALTDNPQALLNEVQRLRDSDNLNDQNKLRALTHVVGESEIAQAFTDRNVLQVRGTEAQEFEARQTPRGGIVDINAERFGSISAGRPGTFQPSLANLPSSMSVEERRQRLLQNIQAFSEQRSRNA